MFHKIIIVIVACFILGIEGVFACSPAGQPPLPGLYPSWPFKDTACVGEALEFDGNYRHPMFPDFTNDVTHIWDFGDSTPILTIPPPNPISAPYIIHTYQDSGHYKLALTKMNPFDTITDTFLIVIYPNPVAYFNYTISPPCVSGGPVSFTDLSISDKPIISWKWTFGDGDTSILQNPNHAYALTYQQPNVYLEVENAGGCKSLVSRNLADTTIAQISYLENCPCSDLTFIASGNATNYSWDFGDGTIASGTNVSHTFVDPEEYKVTLTGTNGGGCSYTLGKTIDICPGETIYQPSKSNNNWYFHHLAGVSFESGTAVPLLDGQSSASGGALQPLAEGQATVSHPITGEVLFYTDGNRVWNRMHAIMDSGLTADPSAAQGALIIPFPGDTNKYYIITSAGYTTQISAPFEIRYSVVDMSLNSGLGQVTLKNILLANTSGSEAVSAVLKSKKTHCKNAQYWLTNPNNGTINVYLVDSSGISFNHTSNAGMVINGDTSTVSAYSKSGTKYALVKGIGKDTSLVLDFDPISGMFSNPKKIPNSTPLFSGIVFSPNEKLLYGTAYTGSVANTVFQYDLEAENIGASERILGGGIETGLGLSVRATMWLGDDGKIYFGKSLRQYLGVINNPDIYGPGANFNAEGLYLGGRSGSHGLQNIVNLTLPTPQEKSISLFTSNNAACQADVLFTNLVSPLPYTDNCSWLYNYDTQLFTWDFGDSTAPIITTSPNVISHTYTQSGSYNASLIVERPFMCTSDTFFQTINIYLPPSVSFVADTVCQGDTTHFVSTISNVDNPPISYNWSVPLNDTAINVNYVFNTGGIYTVLLTITDSVGCQDIDTNDVLVKSFPIVSVSADTVICSGNTVQLYASGGNSYNWSPVVGLNVDTISMPLASTATTTEYAVIATNECGTDTASVNIEVINCTIYIPNVFTPNGDGANDVFQVRGEGVSQFLFKVYDRWGSKVFESKSGGSPSEAEGWDGIGFNKGVYVYRLIATMLSGEEVEKVGNVTLIR